MSGDVHQQLAQAIIDGDLEDAKTLALKALEMGLNVYTCIQDGLAKGIQQIGERYASGEYLLPDLIKRADAVEAVFEIFQPAMSGDQEKEVITFVVLEAMDGDDDIKGEITVGTMLTGNDLTEKNNPLLLKSRA